MRFFGILDGIKNSPSSPPMFPEPFPVSDRFISCFLIIIIKIIIIISQHATGCSLFCLFCQILISVSVLFALNLMYSVAVSV